jgi:hypothetical protein
MRVSMGALSGLGACAQTDPYPATYESVNCPQACFLAGQFFDWTLGQECWPCHNACPTGYCWDTTNLVCSLTPATSSTPAQQNDAAPPAAIDCTSLWNQWTNAQCGGSSTPLMIGGILLVVVIGAVAANKLL